MHSLNQPFDASKFNFTKLPLQEILYELRRRQQQDQLLQQHQHIAQDSVQTEDHHPKTSGYPCSLEPSTEKRQIVSDEHNKIVQPGHPRHLLAINVSPLEYGHVLLIPDVDACCNQVRRQRPATLPAVADLCCAVGHQVYCLYYFCVGAVEVSRKPVEGVVLSRSSGIFIPARILVTAIIGWGLPTFK